MLNKDLRLNSKTFNKGVELIPTRNGYGEGLVELGEKNPDVVVLTGDLAESTRVLDFAKKFPERFIECGVAEQNMMGIAAGLAAAGKIPFVSSYAVFSPGRNWDQLRVSVCISNLNVNIAGAHTGVSVGPDGATHQALEDVAITRVLPNMTVVVPCDSFETKKVTLAAASHKGPVYFRFTREATPVMTTDATPFEIGKAEIFYDSQSTNHQSQVTRSVAIVACGPLIYEALVAAKELEGSGIGTIVVNNHTIKPMDEVTITKVAELTGAVVTVEEHQVMGGMGSAVAEVLAKNCPVPMEFIGMQNSFGESGEPDELLEKYKMKSKDIVNACKKVLSRKTD
ncbi:transketolase [Candidatus Woesebacteria bacterium RIFCSPHIGHO2_01_FULL_39_23]|nr:MAG: transketolase [Candidatus Woesebacteria bacterium RIFCSPHIGHO2_01_FULL_39_23]